MNEAIGVHVVSLGCARNLVDSEVLLGHVTAEGLRITPADGADVVVVNTCGFIDAAKEESIEHLLEAVAAKDDGALKGVVAVGCLAERYGQELADKIPELDAVLGISDYSQVPKLIRRIVNGSEQRWVATVDGGAPKSALNDQRRVLLTPKSHAYLRISEGCDHKCTFCAIPSMRGRNRSKPLDVLVREAETLAADGVKELVVVAEDTTAYGLDLEGRRTIHILMERLADVDGIEWVRLMYAYPHTVSKDLTTVIREHPNVVPYLDIPVQHIASDQLKAMRRGVSGDRVREILWRLRDEVPGITVRTTLISGFPGETDAHHEELLKFVEEYRFERLGVFPYSQEETTPAFDMPGQVDPEVAQSRRDQLMEAQQAIHNEHQQALVGQTTQVLIDGLAPDGKGAVGRTVQDAPEVDGSVLLPRAGVTAGDLVSARITASEGYDLHGIVLG